MMFLATWTLSWVPLLKWLEVKKELSLVCKWVDTFWRQSDKQYWIFDGD